MTSQSEWVKGGEHDPKYPLFIVSKGRADSRLTSKALERMGVRYRVIIEEQEHDQYASVIDPSKILHLPFRYKEEYDKFDKLGMTKSTGPGPARNFAWDTAIAEGFDRHWVMDDNIRHFSRFNKNLIVKISNGAGFRAMEEFCDRYENVAMAGPNYEMFAPRKVKVPPFVKNTRIYSCNLILNSSPYRWRGRYNEDTDLSLRMLKDGWCTVQFNAFLQFKTTTQYIKGGNSAEFYDNEGTFRKSEMQVRMHPDVSRMVERFGRIHHFVDYTPFKKIMMKRKDNFKPSGKKNEFGMVLQKVKGVEPSNPKKKKPVTREKIEVKDGVGYEELDVMKIGYKHVNGGGVPGGHNVPWDGSRKPHIPGMTECHSIALRHSDVVADVGAYVGTYSIYCARFPVKKVVAYEPTPRTADILRLTKLPNLEVRNMAVVGDDRRSVDLHISKGIGVTNSIVQERRKAGSITVPAINYIEAVRGASIVKIDVEGAEYDFPIIQPSLRGIIIDFHPMPGDWKRRARTIMEEIRDAGFTPLIEPTFVSGWNVGGSWVREMETEGECEQLMSGQMCCGCGIMIRASQKALCPDCFNRWAKKHRQGFACGRIV